jgi:membrane protease YdiL (CAAX protease family)
MEINASVTDGKKAGFKLFEHPWLAMLAVMLVTVVSIYATAIVVFVILGMPDDKPLGQFLQSISHYLLCTLLLVPFILRLPKGKGSYGKYLEDIGLTRVQPFFRLLLLGLSCSLILMFSQAGATIIYRLFEGIPLNWNFIRQIFDLSGDLPPQSAGLLITIPSMFEELVFRGIVLTTFLNRYSTRNAIIFSSLGFGLMHLLNLANGRDLVWVLGQVAWAFCLGLFYGYIFVSTKSLLPPMIVHYLGNAFIGSLTGYLQARASIEIQALYGVIFSLGIVPTSLMILWSRFYISRWLPAGEQRQSARVQFAAI